MRYKNYYLIILLISAYSCKVDPTGPEVDCHLDDLYVLDYHGINAPKVFDVRTDPPKELRNGTIEYELAHQWAWYAFKNEFPYPYSEYFIDSIRFFDPASVEVHIFESNDSKVYSYARNDCSISLTSQDGDLHLELTNGGNEVSEQRFAIFDYSTRRVTIDTLSFIHDTFPFIEFRLGPFLSYEDIIKQFAIDNPGVYDTIGIELVQNRTRE